MGRAHRPRERHTRLTSVRRPAGAVSCDSRFSPGFFERVRSLPCASAFLLVLAAVAGLLALPAPAAAQTSVTLVSNLGARSGLGAIASHTFDRDTFTTFTTGSHPTGYKLTSVDLYITGPAPPASSTETIQVVVRREAAGAFSGVAITNGPLAAPSSLANGANTFTASGTGIDLQPDTTYGIWVEVTGRGSSPGRLWYQNGDGELAGAAAGWSIGNDSRERPWNGARPVSTWVASLQMAIKGYANAAVGAPGTPTVTAVAGSGGALSVSWAAPTDTRGLAITDYDLRYYAGATDPTNEADWIEEGEAGGHAHTGTERTATITGLRGDTQYRVQVRGQNANGEGAWSASGNAQTGENRAPVVLEGDTADASLSCRVKTGTATPAAIKDAPAGSPVSIALTTRGSEIDAWPLSCTRAGMREVPVFDDKDTQRLTVTQTYTLPENVRALGGSPRLNGTRLSFRGVAAGGPTDVRVDLTATDPHSATASAHVIFRVGSFRSGGAPRLTGTVTNRGYLPNRAITPFTLPGATGGDRTTSNGTAIPNPYIYRATGLPPGLTFDAATRTVSGTPTQSGLFTVTYTADDFDEDYSGKDSPTAADTADAARAAFNVRVGFALAAPGAPAAPRVTQVATAGGSLSVSWSAPADPGTGGPVTDYDLRYYAGNTDPENEADWIVEGDSTALPDPEAATTATITGLKASTLYRVQVRAENAVGEGAWSASGTATTAAASAGNNAPRILRRRASPDPASGVCELAGGTELGAVNGNSNRTVSIGNLTGRRGETGDWPTVCTRTSDPFAPVFDDVDGDTLTLSVSYTLPDNMRAFFVRPVPQVATGEGRVFYRGVAAHRQTDLRVGITATDPHGASVTLNATFRINPPDNDSAPQFARAVGGKGFVVNKRIAPWVLPEATGGDVAFINTAAEPDTTITYPYVYKLTGDLPPGLTFDPETRAVTGAPTTAGTWTVTYTADDADSAHSLDGATSPDTASQEITVNVGTPPSAPAASPGALVGNTGQTATANPYTLNGDLAQTFTTGSNPGGYTLTAVKGSIKGGSATPPYTAQIFLADTNTGRPTGSSLGTLANPASLSTSGTKTWTASGSGIDLEAGTSYVFVLDVSALVSTTTAFHVTDSDAQDLGASSGWSIDDNRLLRAAVVGRAWKENADAAQIAIHGQAKNPPPTVTPGSTSGSLSVSWLAPAEAGSSAVTDYDLRYYEGNADPQNEAHWIEEGEAGGFTHSGIVTAATLTGLKAATRYRVQVRAGNAAGEGPWSTSGSAATIAASGTNNPPRLLEIAPAIVYSAPTSCLLKTDTSTPSETLGTTGAQAGSFISIDLVTRGSETTEWPTTCTTSGNRFSPVFDDRDAETLTISMRYTLPDNVRAMANSQIGGEAPRLQGDRLWLAGVAAGATTDLRIDLTAVDPKGASATTHVVFRVGTFSGSSGAPRFAATASSRSFPANRGIAPFLLPAATGGDVTTPVGFAIPNPYLYTVSGLPPGLAFDPLTRRVSGTPTAEGLFTVTYTVDDFDRLYSRKASPTPADLADSATQSFEIEVGPAPPPPATPGAPDAPQVTQVTTAGGSLSVSWSAPTDPGTGGAVTDYDLRYYAGNTDPLNEADWVVDGDSSGLPDADTANTATSATITGLKPSTLYRVQVRAENASGEGEWSASGSATTAAAKAGNNAPRILQRRASPDPDSGVCQLAGGTELGSVTGRSNRLVSIGGLTGRRGETADWPTVCTRTSDPFAPVFDDVDGDTLTLAVSYTLPDNMRAFFVRPVSQGASSEGRVYFRGVAAHRQTDLRVGIRATDPHGASVTLHATFRIDPPDSDSAPQFAQAVGSKGFVVNQRIAPWVLPVATGGDVAFTNTAADPHTTVTFPYAYAATGLPPGLTFNADTRTVTGTPTTAGTWTVTYTADDADDAHSLVAGTTSADTATQTIIVAVGTEAPGAPKASPGALVGNTGQAAFVTNTVFNTDLAQAFDTGGHSGGYKLTSVKANIDGNTGVLGYAAHIFLADDTTGHPTGTSLGTFTNPSSLAADGTVTWTATGGGINLDASEGYVFYLDLTQPAVTNSPAFSATASDAEDMGAASGWEIADAVFHRTTFNNGSAWNSNTRALRIAIHGREKTTGPAAPTVKAGSTSSSLDVSWGPASGRVAGYDLRYYEGGTDPQNEADWIEEDESGGHTHTGTGTTATITGLKADTAYRVQVRATGVGESAWSDSGGATTGSPPGTNNAPRLLEYIPGTFNPQQQCRVKSNTATPSVKVNEAAGVRTYMRLTWRLTETSDFPASCTTVPITETDLPVFDDQDAEALTLSMRYTLPGNVQAWSGYPQLTQPSPGGSQPGGLAFRGVAAGAAANAPTDVRFDLTAVDPHGASASTHVIFQINSFPDGAGAPRLLATAGSRTFRAHRAIAPFVLPAATGGDVATPSDVAIPNPYLYAVTGLPPGLAFDPATRAVSGTPTAEGLFTVTYTVDDFDAAYSGKDSPIGADLADSARQTFTLTVTPGAPPRAEPGPPETPTVEAVSTAGGSLKVSWSAPADPGTGGPVTDYDLRYYAGNTDPENEADWVVDGDSSGLPDADTANTATSATITGLKASTLYRVQVRAENASGEGAWSASGTATTAAAKVGNNAPRILRRRASPDPDSGVCELAGGTELGAVSGNSNRTVSIGNLTGRRGETGDWPTVCTRTSDPFAPVFDDVDGDTLTLSVSYTLPDNMQAFFVRPFPQVGTGEGRVFYRGVAAHRQTDLRVGITATDPHGASVTLNATFRITPPDNDSAPAFARAVGGKGFVVNKRIAPWVLPEATGGDVAFINTAAEPDTTITYPYVYKLTGDLPPGLTYDPETRTVTGTPTTAGTWTFTYTADDADGAYSLKAGAEATDKADAASEEITVTVGLAPGAPGTGTSPTGALVGNTGQTSATSGAPRTNKDLAQAFTTGGHTGGYKLTAVRAKIAGHGAPGTHTAHIFKADTNTGLPTGSSLGTFTNPSLSSSGLVKWTATGGGIDLDAGTGYLFVVDVSVVGFVFFDVTASDAEDSGAASGWSVDNVFAERTGISNSLAWGRPANSDALQIEVHGYEKAPGPTAPTVAAVANTGGSLKVSWFRASGAVTGYDLRYYAGSADPLDAADWIEPGEPGGFTHTGTATTATLTGLLANTAYRVQVRAANGAVKGPWSESGAAVTGSPPAGNHPVTLMEHHHTPLNVCRLKTDTSTPARREVAPSGTWHTEVHVTTRGTEDTQWPTLCASGGQSVAPVFDDRDGVGDLTISLSYALPDNVRLLTDAPRMIGSPRKRLFFGAFAAGATTDVRLDLTAVDAHGVSATTHVVYNVTVSPDQRDAPRFLAAAASRSFPANQAIAPFVLPAATAGDVPTVEGTTLPDPYLYAVRGLPPGLLFDRETRAVSGTPTAEGSYTVTYTADDFDADYSRKASPTAADLADAALQTFTVKVGGAQGAPGAPGSPTVKAVANTGGSLSVSWRAPSDTGTSALSDYDLRWYAGGADPENEADWIEAGETGGHDHQGTARRATLKGLVAETAYRVQVRAANASGKGAWSDSGGGTTGSPPSTNHPVRLLEADTTGSLTDGCQVKTDTSTSSATVSAPAGGTVSVNNLTSRVTETSEWPALCAKGTGNTAPPVFDDRDAEQLTVSMRYVLPDNVRTWSGFPRLRQPIAGNANNLGRAFMQGVAAGAHTDVRIDLTAVDRHGAAASTHVVFTVNTTGNKRGAPRFAETAGNRIVAANRAITPFVLPAASGGETTTAAGDAIPNPYLYTVGGLPPGLTFDPATRRVSGTPVRTGLFTVTYSADDFDALYSRKPSASADDLADAARQTFTVRVAALPGAPGAPGKPTVAAVANTGGSLTVGWSAPPDTGSSAIADYDVRYFQGTSDPDDEADWTEAGEPGGHDHVGASPTGATLTGLLAETAYRVQVRAVNGAGAGPWSDSGGGTTGTPPAGNNAPILLKLGNNDDCVEKDPATDTTPFGAGNINGTLHVVGPLAGRDRCSGSSRAAPMFEDPDGDALTYSVSVTERSDNVRLFDGYPFILAPNLAAGEQGRVLFNGIVTHVASGRVGIQVTAVDPHGASASRHVRYASRALGGSSAPGFAAAVGSKGFAVNRAIAPWVLPEATGGDAAFTDSNTGQTIVVPYVYAASGLPPGLAFDAATRTVTGTPGQSGTWTVTYTADDADIRYSLKTTPDPADTADAARQTIEVTVGAAPGAPGSSPGTLVSNFGQTGGNTPVSLALHSQAQGFTTGSHSGGYILGSVEAQFSVVPANTLSVQLATGLPSATTVVATLSNPSALGTGVLKFTAPAGTTLKADTTYYVVVSGGIVGAIDATPRSGEDTGGPAGWSLSDGSRFRLATSSGSWTLASDSLRLRVNGRTVSAAPPTVKAVANTGGSLSVSWLAASGAVTDYDLRYFAGGTDPANPADWIEEGEPGGHTHTGTATTATLTGLVAETGYRVQVRAANANGEGPWSPSGSGTTGEPPGTNNAPRLLEYIPGTVTGQQQCRVKTSGASAPSVREDALAGQESAILLSARGTEEDAFPSYCTNGNIQAHGHPVFDDQDAEQLTLSMRYTLPHNLRAWGGHPRLTQTVKGDANTKARLSLQAVMAGVPSGHFGELRIDLAAVDPHGASASTHVVFRVYSFPSSVGAPRFAAAAGARSFAANRAIAPFVLPAATGGDTALLVLGASTPIPDPYLYTVSGLPPGLTFDRATRTVSGTPTVPGVYTVTYAVDDFDADWSGRPSPTAADLADAAAQSFQVLVGVTPPAINEVRIVSASTYASGSRGLLDTYVRGDRILIDVGFSEAMTVTGGNDNVTMRLDLGADDNGDLAGRQRVATLDSVLHGDQVLRFAYTVQGGNGEACSSATTTADCDPDGIRLQTAAAGDRTIVFLANGASVASSDRGAAADLRGWVRPTGGVVAADQPSKVERSKVDGGVAASPGPAVESLEIDGKTLTVTFDKALAPFDSNAAANNFSVHASNLHGGQSRNASQHPSWVSGSGATVTLTLQNPVRAGDRVTLSHFYTENIRALWDAAVLHPVPEFNQLEVTNRTRNEKGEVGVVLPLPVRADVAADALRVVFDRALDAAARPAGDAFTVDWRDTNGDTGRTPGTGTAIVEGTVVHVTLAGTVRPGGTADVSYRPPQDNPLQDADGLEVAAIARFVVGTVNEVDGPTLVHGLISTLEPAGPGGDPPGKSQAVLYFNKALNTGSVPAVGDFRLAPVESDATQGAAITKVAVEATAMVLTTDRRLKLNRSYTLSYTPGARPIRDTGGNRAAAFTHAASAYAVSQPVLRGALVYGDKVRLHMLNPLDPAGVPAPSAFTLWARDEHEDDGVRRRDRVSGRPIRAVAVEAAAVVLTLNEPVLPCAGLQAFRVSYTRPSTGWLRTIGGWAANSWTATHEHALVTNERHGSCAEWLSGGRVSSIILRAMRPFAPEWPPQAAWFTVTASGGPVTVTGAAFVPTDSRELKLTLDRKPAPGETITVSYRRPRGVMGLWDVDGNQLRDVVNASIPNPAKGVSGVALVSDPGGDAAYGLGDALRVGLTFTEAVDVTGAPRLRIDLDPAAGGERWADYESGSGTTDLTFAYTVTGTDVSTAGVAVLADSLEANGGSLRWTASQAAAELAHGGLAHDPAHQVDGTPPVALTAAFHGVPAVHDGSRRFEFELRLSEEIAGLKLRAVEAALSAAGGRIVAVKRAVAGEMRRLTVQARPDSAADVTLTLAATTDCTAAGAICAADGRMLSGAVTATVPYGAPLTAALHGVPATHDGSEPFSFEVRFNQEFQGLDLAAFAAGALQVTNGRVVEAAQTVAGQNRSVTLRVYPTSWRDVTLSLAATADCTAAGAVCTPDGRALSSTARATVTGPPPLTAAFHGVPAVHYGDGLLSFEVRFNQEFRGLRLTAFEAGALQVTGGRLVDARRAAEGENRSITVRVRPASYDDVVLTLAATTADCTAAAAVCAVDGRKLSNTSTATITGLAPLTAEFHGVPDRHDGSEPFSFEVRFNQEFQGLRLEAFAAGALQLGNGRLVEAAQTVAGQNRSVTLRVIPTSWRDVTLSLPATTTGCSAESAICTTDGRKLSNTVTATVQGPPPLTAAFHGVPAEHDGSHLFGFEIRFNQEFRGLRLPAFQNGALQVTGGRLVDAKRAAAGENRSINVRVRPAGFDDMVVTLPATTDCAAAGAICAVDGRMLSNTVTATVRGPVTISVADAEAEEGAGVTIDFTVTLNRAAAGTVTVDYATADGTATAGEDYTATSGTLTFAAGVLAQTVAVALLDDAIDEGRETFTLMLSNPTGAVIADGEAVGTIINTDLMPKAWNARFGRAVAVHVVDAVEARLEGDSESFVQVGGHRLGGAQPDVLDTVQSLAPELDLFAQDEGNDANTDPAASLAGQTVTFRDLLLGSAFHLVSQPGDQPDAPRLSAWGRVAASGFDAVEDKLSLNGTVTTASLGVDGTWKRWLTGLLLAYSEGDGSFSHADLPGGDVASTLTSLHPYAAYRLTDRVRLWGTVGYGSGALRLLLDAADADDGEGAEGELTPEAERRLLATDLAMTMGALGVRGELLRPARGVQLALRSDVLWMAMDSAAAPNLGATTAEVSRLRLVLEGSRPVSLAGGGTVTPTLQLGLRHDGGDAETGTGVEVGAGLRYASAWGLSLEASARALLAHEAQDYREWGASGALRYDPGRQGKGFTASIMPTWGTAGSGVERLWGLPGGAGLGVPGVGTAPAAGRLDAELGYGLAALRGRGLLTPYARVALTEGADQAWHLGARLAVAESLNLSLEASRRSMGGADAAHDLALLATLGF